jgi:GNAT superfamily N-acetyltransferase
MLSDLEQRLLTKGWQLRVDPMEDFGFIYSITDLLTLTEYAYLVITYGIEYKIQNLEQYTIHCRDLWVHEDYRKRGIGRLLLFYGLSHMMKQTPDIRYSDLEDDSEFPFDEPGNLYYAFGYRFKEGDPQEKWLDLEEFKRNRDQLFLSCKLK